MRQELIFLTDVPKEYPWATVRYLRRIRQLQTIPVHKRGRRILFDRKDIETLTIEIPARSSLGTGSGR